MKKHTFMSHRKGIKRIAAILLAFTVTSNVTMVDFYKDIGNAQIRVAAESIKSSSDINVLETVGWTEAAYIKWTAVSDADAYKVYYKLSEQDDSNYTLINNELIRVYDGYYRADILGISKGTYDIKIVACNSGSDIAASVKKGITVSSHVREGFSFSKESVTGGQSSGGYNESGVLPENAQVIYVSQENVNTVTLDVIKDSKGNTTTAVGLAEILNIRKKGYDTTPLVIRMIGTIRGSDVTGLNSSGYLEIKEASNITLEGVGDDATIYGFAFLIRNATNIEVRNLGFMLFPDDGISLDTGNNNIWIHNNDIFYGAPGSDSDQVKGDGSCDVKKFSNYITVSYNHFWDSGKASLCGLNEEKEYFVSYHHNWFDHSDSRHPRIRTGSVHVYNNYYDGNSKYGVGVTSGASAFVESNVFRNCKYPMLSSLQGTEYYQGSTTFSSETGGIIKAYNNQITGAKSLIYASQDAVQFDAYDVQTREEQVPNSYVTYSGGTSYNNFDTLSTMYDYEPTDIAEVESHVTKYAGRVENGDFEWEFDDATEDTSSDINESLKSAITNYTSALLSIGGAQNGNVVTSEASTTTIAAETTTQQITTTSQNVNGEGDVTVSDASTENAGADNTKEDNTGSQQALNQWTIGGCQESLFAQWQDNNAKAAKVYYRTANALEYQEYKDTDLIRQIADNTARVDILGLQAGTYDLKVISSSGDVYVKKGIRVTAYDRSGYAHFNYSNGIGAYQDNGQIKNNTITINVTNENKDSITVPGYESYATGIGNILNGNGNSAPLFKALAADGKALAIRIIGTVNAPEGLTEYNGTGNGGTVGDNGNMALIRNAKNITIEGVGSDACIDGWGISFNVANGYENYESYEVRNITFKNAPEDELGFQGVMSNGELTKPIERIWVHNNSFYSGYCENPAESDKGSGDGSCDFKRGRYYTVSYNYFDNCKKTSLIGSGDSDLQYDITIHHNYYKDCNSRLPLVRQANVHIYNNYYYGSTSKTVDARANAFVFSEANYYEACKNPVNTKSGAVVKSYNDIFDNCTEDNLATIVSGREEILDSECTYANFDTNSSIFYYDSAANVTLVSHLTDASTAKAECILQAGVLKNSGTVEDNYGENSEATSTTQSEQSSTATNATQDTQESEVTNSTQSTQDSGTTNDTQSTQDSGATNGTQSTQDSGATNGTQSTQSTQDSGATNSTQSTQDSGTTNGTQSTQDSGATNDTQSTQDSGAVNTTQDNSATEGNPDGTTQYPVENPDGSTTEEVNLPGYVEMGTYEFNKFNIDSTTTFYNNIYLEVRSLENEMVKLRNENRIVFAVNRNCKLQMDPVGKPVIISAQNGGQITYGDLQASTIVTQVLANHSEVVTVELIPGIYCINGSAIGSNTELSRLVFEEISDDNEDTNTGEIEQPGTSEDNGKTEDTEQNRTTGNVENTDDAGPNGTTSNTGNAGGTPGDTNGDGTENPSGTTSNAGTASGTTGDTNGNGTENPSGTTGNTGSVSGTTGDTNGNGTEGSNGTTSNTGNAGGTTGDTNGNGTENLSGTTGNAGNVSGTTGDINGNGTENPSGATGNTGNVSGTTGDINGNGTENPSGTTGNTGNVSGTTGDINGDGTEGPNGTTGNTGNVSGTTGDINGDGTEGPNGTTGNTGNVSGTTGDINGDGTEGPNGTTGNAGTASGTTGDTNGDGTENPSGATGNTGNVSGTTGDTNGDGTENPSGTTGDTNGDGTEVPNGTTEAPGITTGTTEGASGTTENSGNTSATTEHSAQSGNSDNAGTGSTSNNTSLTNNAQGTTQNVSDTTEDNIYQVKLQGMTVTYKNVVYMVIVSASGKYSLAAVGATSKSLKSLVVSNTVSLNGRSYKVTEIRKNAFSNLKKVKKITIGKNVSKIGKNAFKNCKNCKKLVINSKNLKKLHKKAFAGMSKKVKLKLAKKSYKKLLKKAGLGV